MRKFIIAISLIVFFGSFSTPSKKTQTSTSEPKKKERYQIKRFFHYSWDCTSSQLGAYAGLSGFIGSLGNPNNYWISYNDVWEQSPGVWCWEINYFWF